MVYFPVVSLVASLDHRLQAGIPKGCEGSGLVGRRCLTRRACSEGAGRRTLCAERAVILTAVQSLRLAGSEGAELKIVNSK